VKDSRRLVVTAVCANVAFLNGVTKHKNTIHYNGEKFLAQNKWRKISGAK
jgi:hypothetical protein